MKAKHCAAPGTALLSGWLLLAGCGAVFPQFKTPVQKAPADRTLEPPAPAGMLYLEFLRASVPSQTRDGRDWDATGGALPDVFARLLVDGEELLVTEVEPNTLKPTFKKQLRGNYRVPRKATISVEVWDDNPLVDQPICLQTLPNFHERVSTEGPLEIDCENGARVDLRVEPARPVFGLGLFYEIGGDSVTITRVVGESPASRAGLEQGDSIESIMNEPVSRMKIGRIRSLMNSRGATGLALGVRGDDDKLRKIELRDGPIYATLDEDYP